jgi:hypothetical protein
MRFRVSNGKYDGHQFIYLGPVMDFNVYNDSVYALRNDGNIWVRSKQGKTQHLGVCLNCTTLPFLLYNGLNDGNTVYHWEPVANFIAAFLLVVVGTMCWHYRKIALDIVRMVLHYLRHRRNHSNPSSLSRPTPPVIESRTPLIRPVPVTK